MGRKEKGGGAGLVKTGKKREKKRKGEKEKEGREEKRGDGGAMVAEIFGKEDLRSGDVVVLEKRWRRCKGGTAEAIGSLWRSGNVEALREMKSGDEGMAITAVLKERNGVEKLEEEQQQLLRPSSSSGAGCCTVWGLSGVVAQQQHVPLRGVGWLRQNSSRAALR
ncbi:hypothetical protein F0562_024018 [Nyssa sinensis]|uniref:Uncharacterized protein n=1 Tax=Nyssa sinensis TaxID=561372 RepID=A0A5J5BJL4_9ASTE|nr:hypothetical protein F0562_024018 [Nyssa sinensis]